MPFQNKAKRSAVAKVPANNADLINEIGQNEFPEEDLAGEGVADGTDSPLADHVKDDEEDTYKVNRVITSEALAKQAALSVIAKTEVPKSENPDEPEPMYNNQVDPDPLGDEMSRRYNTLEMNQVSMAGINKRESAEHTSSCDSRHSDAGQSDNGSDKKRFDKIEAHLNH